MYIDIVNILHRNINLQIEITSETAFNSREKEENFNNARKYSVGATYKLDNAWTIRGGVAFDEGAVSQSVETMINLRIADIIIPALTALLAILVMKSYSLNEKRASQ